MASFTKTFGEGRMAQPVTNDPAARVFGAAMKITGLGALATLAVGFIPVTAVGVGIAVATAVIGIGGGAAIGADAVQNGQSFARKLTDRLVLPWKM